VSCSFACIIYYPLQTDRLKLIFVQVMCSEDNQEYKEYLAVNSLREGALKLFCCAYFFLKSSYKIPCFKLFGWHAYFGTASHYYFLYYTLKEIKWLPTLP